MRLRADVALIGGTGIGSRLVTLSGRMVVVPTEFGNLRGKLVEHEGLCVLLVQRHSSGHKTPPHGVNYKAIARGLKQMGVKGCFSTAASGCLRPEWGVGTVTVCSDFIDMTGRNLTMFEEGVQHRDFTSPLPLGGALLRAATDLGLDVATPCTYLCVNGPRYETPAEIRAFQTLGADIVGMTAASEAIALREEGVDYGLLGIVTNAASGMGGAELAHDEVTDAMEAVGDDVVRLLLRAAVLVGKG